MGIGNRSAKQWAVLTMLAGALCLSPAGSWAQGTGGADGETPEEDPPYLNKDRDIDVFDPPEFEKLGQIRQAAERIYALKRTTTTGRTLGNQQSLETYEYWIEGQDEGEILAEARRRALQSAAARLYFDKYFLLGRDVLAPYLEQRSDEFISATDITNRRILADEQMAMNVRLGVNLDKLFSDLDQKRFIAQPNLRPVLGVVIDQTVNDEATPDVGGRERMERVMQENLYRSNTREMQLQTLNQDLTGSEEALRNARLEAQRHDIDVLITGSLDIYAESDTQILFDDYSFYKANLDLKMYRVDNAEVIAEINQSYSASGESKEAAINTLLDALMERVAEELSSELRGMWGVTMLDEADYRLMFSNVDPNRIANVKNSLMKLSPEIKLYEKAYYGDTLVLNVVLPEAVKGELEGFLRNSNEPMFRVDKISDRHFELEVL